MAECIARGTVTDDDLLAAADGEAGPTVLAHLAQCTRCANVALAYAQAQQRLTRAVFRLDCPSSLALAEYVQGVLLATQRQTVAAHLVDCVHCTADVAALRQAQRQEARAAPERGLRRLIATLLPAPVGLAAGLRGRADDGLRVYTAGNLTIALDLLWDQAHQHGEISGLLTTSDGAPLPADIPVELHQADSTTMQSVVVDATATFLFTHLVAGQYQLDLTIDDQLITITEINVNTDNLS